MWIRKALRAIRAPRLVRRMVDILMPGWKTDIEVWTAGGKRRLPICLKRGLFQGDSLSPLLFCRVSPLSHGLRERAGFRSVFQGSPVTHLMYMDDLKVYEESPEKLVDTVAVVEDVLTAIGMTLGLRKCAVAHMRRGRVATRGPLRLVTAGEMAELSGDQMYKYLGVEQLLRVRAEAVKKRVRRAYIHKLHRVWEADLSAGMKRKAHNTWAVPVCAYYLAAAEWSRANAAELDRWTRKVLRRYQAHHANASLERLYLRVEDGGRGLSGVELLWEREMVSTSPHHQTHR